MSVLDVHRERCPRARHNLQQSNRTRNPPCSEAALAHLLPRGFISLEWVAHLTNAAAEPMHVWSLIDRSLVS